MTTHDELMALVADLRSRINPAYATQLGTESYERRICAEAIEALIAERDEHQTNAMRNARSAVSFKAERDALRQSLGKLLENYQHGEALTYAEIYKAEAVMKGTPT